MRLIPLMLTVPRRRGVVGDVWVAYDISLCDLLESNTCIMT